MAEQRAALGSANTSWNRMEVNRCLLPVLRFVDAERANDVTGEEYNDFLRGALQAYQARPDAYRQLAHVFCTGSAQTIEQWFGWIECDDELLDMAFDFINAALNGHLQHETPHISLEQDMYFSGLFHITDEGAPVDLAYPFEQFYFCDAFIYKDYQFRRIELGDKCKAWIRRYQPYYQRVWTWYREHGGKRCAVSVEHHAYMELYEYFLDRIAYEDRLRDDRQALEYERGGLGWFHRDRKREIDRELHELDLAELEMRLEDARERYTAFVAQFEDQRDGWEEELRCAPFTAFGRRKELKQKLVALEEKILQYRKGLALDELQMQYNKLSKKK